jgi:outer membrane protein W
MKSKLLCIALLAAACSASAQKFAQNVSFGPIVGLGHSWIHGVAGDKKFKLAPSAGVTMVYSAGEHWGFGLDEKFSHEGSKQEGPFPNTESTINANYIRVPLKAIYFFGQLGEKVRPKVVGGPSFGFLVGGKQKLEDNNGETLIETKTKDVLNSFDVGFNGGIGLNMRLTRNTWLNTDVSYYHGLKNISKTNDQDWKNRNVTLNVGVAFGIGTIKKD